MMNNDPIIQENFWKWCIAPLDFASIGKKQTLQIILVSFLSSTIWFAYSVFKQKWQQFLEGSYTIELYSDRSSMLSCSLLIEVTLRPSDSGKTSQGFGNMYLQRNGLRTKIARVCCTVDEQGNGNIKKEYDKSDSGSDSGPDARDDLILQFLEQFENRGIALEHLLFNNDFTLSKKGRWYCENVYYGSIKATKMIKE